MANNMHKLFLTTCDVGETRTVTASDCEHCPQGSVIGNKSAVICSGIMKYFLAPCYFDMRASATVGDCEQCGFGEVGEDRIRVFCSRM